MEWDEEAARRAVVDFKALFEKLEASYPECMKRLVAAWREGYLRCGHKRLGRVVLGRTVEEACRVKAAGA